MEIITDILIILFRIGLWIFGIFALICVIALFIKMAFGKDDGFRLPF